MSAYGWHVLCWEGGVSRQAAKVIEACNHAVALAPRVVEYRHSRGLVRALTGDYEGAVLDFELYLGYHRYLQGDSYGWSLRTGWIEQLRASQNPFQSMTEEDLRAYFTPDDDD